MRPSLLTPEAYSGFYRNSLARTEGSAGRIEALSGRLSEPVDFKAWLGREQGDSNDPFPALRRIRNELVCAIIAADLKDPSFARTVSVMTSFADFAVQTAVSSLHAALAAAHGEPIGDTSGRPQKIITLAMGKMGGAELNVSSDIDLIFVYPEDGQTAAKPGQRQLSNHEFFTRLARRFTAALSEVTADGFVFRVDLALRPNGASGPLAAGFNMLEQYFITQGREWERYAWIKARPVTGDEDGIAQLGELAHPFVFRKYLDYGVIEAIRHLHAQIRADVVRQEKLHPERNANVKLGRGGIREIEFITQMYQLLRAGKDPSLNLKPTRAVLKQLAVRRLMDKDVTEKLDEAYVFLRNVEHRLQYLADAQTHSLPAGDAELANLALACGMESAAELTDALKTHRDYVASRFDDLFADKTEREKRQPVFEQPLLNAQTKDEQLDALSSRLTELGFKEPAGPAKRMLSFWHEPRISSLSDKTKTKILSLFNRVLPGLTEHSLNPERGLARLLEFLESISRRTAYLSLLTEYPGAATRLMTMLDTGEWPAQYLTRHPVLLDELLDSRTLLAEPDWNEFRRELNDALAIHEGDTEALMDTLREVHHAQLFRELARDLSGALTVEKLADELSLLADILCEAAITQAWAAMNRRHRDVPKFAIVAYGKLGGKELGYASDLDLVFLYEDDHPDASVLYARLAQRFISWMSTPTAAGVLFEIDVALRPDGASGLAVSSFDAFERYQETTAQSWEHQALTRARFCAGDKDIGEKFEALRNRILRKHRESNTLKNDIVSMRAKILDAHPNRSAMFDIKHDPGGMIDIEFIVQYLVLVHAEKHPEMTGNLGNIALLKISENLGLIPPGSGQRVSDIYRSYRRLQHQIRMQGAQEAKVPAGQLEDETKTVIGLWETVFGPR